MRREISAGGVVVERGPDDRYAIVAIRPRGRPEGHWALPKGHVDAGEQALEAALREVREETGLACEADERLGTLRYVFSHAGERVFKIVTFWRMHPVGGTIGAIDEAMRVEVSDVRWLPLAEAPSLLAYGDERGLVRRLAVGLGVLADEP